MAGNGSTGIGRPLTMIRSTWSRSGVATTTLPVGPTASTPSKISTSTPWTTARALRTARTSPRSQRPRRSPRRRAARRPARPRLRDQPGDPGPWDRPAIHGGRGRRFRRQPTCHPEQWAARPGPYATLVLIRSRRPAFHVDVASYRYLLDADRPFMNRPPAWSPPRRADPRPGLRTPRRPGQLRPARRTPAIARTRPLNAPGLTSCAGHGRAKLGVSQQAQQGLGRPALHTAMAPRPRPDSGIPRAPIPTFPGTG